MENRIRPPLPRRGPLPHELPLTAESLEMIAGRFKVLSEPFRLRLLAVLQAGEKNVSELVQATQATQANVSRHLHTLTQAGILCRRKEGLNVYYAIADPTIFELCNHVCGSLQSRLDEQRRALSGKA